VRIRLDRRDLLRGRLVVVAIEIDAPAIRLVRHPDGRIAFEVGTPAAGGGSDVESAASALQRLEDVSVLGGRIVFLDEASTTSWTMPHVDADAWRGADGWRVQLAMTLASADAAIPIWVDATYRPASGSFDAELSSPGADTGTAFTA